MATPQRTVRQLRLSAPSRAQVLSMLPRLEDALRCASLPDEGARLLVLRRLALGRLRPGIDATALARLIEQRVAAAEGGWVDATAPAAASAQGVVFASVLAARTLLARRLLQGQPAGDWYWPLAVPEAPTTRSPHDRLRAIAWAVAQSPEASVALPAWVVALLRDGGAAVLAGLWSPGEGAALLRCAGLLLSGTGRDGGGLLLVRPAGTRAAQRTPPWPAWLQHLSVTDRGGSAPAPSVATGQRGQRRDQALAGPPASPGPHGSVPDLADHRPPAGERPAVDPAEPSSAAAAQADGGPQLRLDTPPAWWAWSPGEPTAAAGLLFLLPVLARLGLPAWRAAQGDTPAFVAVVLGLALQRLRVAHEDAAWLLIGSLAGPWAAGAAVAPVGALTTEPAAAAPALRAGRPAAPVCWHDLRLVPRGQTAGVLAWQLATAPTDAAQAALWLDACRRWLRRIGGVGLASLVGRPGRLALTSSHADVHFELDQTDLRVRRLGLDIDPQWLPWFGRVVAFHYRQGPR